MQYGRKSKCFTRTGEQKKKAKKICFPSMQNRSLQKKLKIFHPIRERNRAFAAIRSKLPSKNSSLFHANKIKYSARKRVEILHQILENNRVSLPKSSQAKYSKTNSSSPCKHRSAQKTQDYIKKQSCFAATERNNSKRTSLSHANKMSTREPEVFTGPETQKKKKKLFLRQPNQTTRKEPIFPCKQDRHQIKSKFFSSLEVKQWIFRGNRTATAP